MNRTTNTNGPDTPVTIPQILKRALVVVVFMVAAYGFVWLVIAGVSTWR